MAAAIATSLCVSGITPVAAQGPPHNPASNVTKTKWGNSPTNEANPTKWANYPADANTGKLLPAASQPPFAVPPVVVTPQPTARVVVFQKEADEDTAKKRDGSDQLKFPASQVNRPDPAKVFRMESDSGLDQRLTEELYQAARNAYNEKLSRYEKDKLDPDSTARKPEPDLRSRLDFTPPDVGFDQTKSMGYVTRTGTYPPTQAKLEPGFIVHRRLMFEELNAERYGWDLGLLSPVVSTTYFYKDLLLWPAHMASNWRERYATNAGKYMPGTPVPYFLYPPEITITGGAVGAGAIVATSLLLLP